MNKIVKVLLWVLGIVFGLFAATFTIYFFNLDMKAIALVEPFLQKHYDKMPRKQYI